MFTIVAFLQNLWIPEPGNKIIKNLIDTSYDEQYRRSVIRDVLFSGGFTGRRLKSAFGDDLCSQIIWEEASREIAGNASVFYPPDLDHIRKVLNDLQPTIVIAFGRSSAWALNSVWQGRLICLPHPAARQANVMPLLQKSRAELEHISTLETTP